MLTKMAILTHYNVVFLATRAKKAKKSPRVGGGLVGK